MSNVGIPIGIVCSVDIQVREDVTPISASRDDRLSADGYIFEGYASFSPRSVGVTGDRDAIASMNRVVRTAPIDLRGRTETFTVEVPVQLPPGVRLVPEDQLISVTVRISPQTTTRQYEEVPVIVTGLDEARYQVRGLANTVGVHHGAGRSPAGARRRDGWVRIRAGHRQPPDPAGADGERRSGAG